MPQVKFSDSITGMIRQLNEAQQQFHGGGIIQWIAAFLARFDPGFAQPV